MSYIANTQRLEMAEQEKKATIKLIPQSIADLESRLSGLKTENRLSMKTN